MKFLKYLWRIIKATKSLIVATLCVLSLVLNLLIASGGLAFRMASSAYEAVTGSRSVATRHADEIANLSIELADERRLKRELTGEVSDLSTGLVGERRLNRELRSEIVELGAHVALQKTVARKTAVTLSDRANEIADLGVELTNERRLKRELRSEIVGLGDHVAVQKAAVRTTAAVISDRAKTMATRGTRAMVAKAVPYFGTAVIVGVTAMELSDLCQTIKDMNALKRVFEPGAEPDEREVRICAMRVPTRQELWEAAKNSPAQAWEAAAELTPTLEELQSIEIPDIDWDEYWASTAKSAEDWWAYSADGATQSWDGMKRWWNSEY